MDLSRKKRKEVSELVDRHLASGVGLSSRASLGSRIGITENL